MPPDSDATTVAASEGEVQKKLAASKKPQEPETNTSMEADSHRPKLSQRTQSKEFLKEKEQPERSPDPVAGAHVAKSHATAVKAKAQPPVSVRVPPKTEEEATAEAVAQCLQRNPRLSSTRLTVLPLWVRLKNPRIRQTKEVTQRM